jgi:hypothetical protein
VKTLHTFFHPVLEALRLATQLLSYLMILLSAFFGQLAELTFDHLQQREDHWAVVDLVGKAGHIRTVPVPDWVKQVIDDWLTAAGVGSGRLFRCVSRAGTM